MQDEAAQTTPIARLWHGTVATIIAAAMVNWRTVGLALIFPIAWAGYTLVRGEIVDGYPDPFIDVADLGYGRVVLNIVLIAALFVAVGAAYLGADRRIRPAPRHRPDIGSCPVLFEEDSRDHRHSVRAGRRGPHP